MELNVVVFNIPAMLESLFKDSNVNCYKNLVVNPNNHFGEFKSADGKLGDVNSGKWYKTAYKNCIIIPKSDFLCLLI